MIFDFSSETKEAVREFVRVILLSIIPVVIVVLEAPEVGLKAGILAVVIAVLRATDKFLHERGSRFQLPI